MANELCKGRESTVWKHGMERHQKPLPAREPAQAGDQVRGVIWRLRCRSPRSRLRRRDPALHAVSGGAVSRREGAVEGEAFMIPLRPKATPRRPQRTRRRTPSCASSGRYRERIWPATGYRGAPRSRPIDGSYSRATKSERPCALGRGPMWDGEPLVRLRVAPHGIRRLRVRASIRNKTTSSDSGFDFKLPSC
jgi:hypothetical protein